MHFASDNWASVAPEVADALAAAAAAGRAPAYGGDETTARAAARLAAFFEREATVLFTATGTAANAIALAATAAPGGVAFCHRDAHVLADEANAPGFFAHGLRLDPIDGARGRIAPDGLAERLAAYPAGAIRHGRPVALTLTQVTEVGTVYRPDDVAALAETAHAHGLAVHMDGARLCNALAFLDAAPADLTWRAGVDILSLGFTKLGAWCAEAVVVFDERLARDLVLRRKQAGQEFSKMRFAAAQFVALLEGEAWRRHARHANAMAAALGEAAVATGRAARAWPCESNEVFLRLERGLADRLLAGGARFAPWDTPGIAPGDRAGPGEGIYRFVTDLFTREDEIAAFAERLRAA